VSEELFISPVDETVSGAAFSDDGVYRWRLWRTWGPGELMAWVMLNPSTADAEVNDPTIRRCMGFARREGYDGIEVVNLYGLRATKPKHLIDHPDPEGPHNRLAWAEALYGPRIGIVIAAWGAAATEKRLPPSRALWGYAGPPMRCLGVTKDACPRHPLYARGDTKMEMW